MRGDFIPLAGYPRVDDDEVRERARAFRDTMQTRRTVRHFSDRPVPREVIEDCLLTAGSAPNGANRQPWHFVAVQDPELRRSIREAAEREEHEFYNGRASQEWLQALDHLGTDEFKPFLEVAPWLIVVFAESYELTPAGTKTRNYYVTESVGIATGMLISACHMAGLATLTHTPSPMRFLNDLLGRPYHERPFLVLVVGHPAEDAEVPDIRKKPLSRIATFR